jgi:hypothetical protein
VTTLETRRIRGDLNEVYKILKGIVDVKEERFFTRVKGCTRGHDLKLFKPSYCLDCRKYAFSNRVINMWNNLLSDVVACSTVYSFKHKIDSFLNCQGFLVSKTFFPLPTGLFTFSLPSGCTDLLPGCF